MKRVVTLISGRGSNLQALVEARIPGAAFVGVVSNRPEAKGLAFARSVGIETAVVDHRTFETREAFEEALHATVERFNPDLVVLAGFMRVLGEEFVRYYEGRMLNIHPSLLPAFPGLNTHARALAAGCRVHGATVHFVTPEVDGGPIVIQGVVPVLPKDTAETLAARVLRVEHRIYPQAVRWFVEGRLRWRGGGGVEVVGGRVEDRVWFVPALEE
ncbi:MAG: phosphoribosylglycinamide formyltransferase [Hydrogenophilus sp.]|nr:phosphoribosylglycinamide formyltransferase [Hydrogenophilus sp.]